MTKLTRAAVALLAIGSVLVLAPAAAAEPATGYLDRTFGGDGKVQTNIAGDGTGEGVAVQADGKIVVIGTANGGTDIALVRYDTDGELDSTFGGGDGKVVTDVSGDDAAFAVAIQTDQSILVGGFADGTLEAALLRYDTDGTLDTTFGGGDGVALTAVGQGAIFTSLVMQPDDSIVAGGTMTPDGIKGEFLVVRYDPTGTPDSTFGGGDGIQTTVVGTAGGYSSGSALQGDGSIVLAGTAVSGTGNENVELVRYDSTGTLDTTFGAGATGKVTTDIGAGPDEADDVALQSDGKIVVVGSSNFQKAFVARFTTGGVLDTTFSGDGKTLTKLGGFGGFTAIVIQPDDAILATGPGALQNGYAYADGFTVVRYTTAGALDPTFGGTGKVFTAFSAGFSNGAATGPNAIALQSDGKVVVAGTVPGSKGAGDIAAARYGTLTTAVLPRADLSIGHGGTFVGNDRYNATARHQTLIAKISPGHSATFTIRIQNDGNAPDTVVVQGSAGSSGVSAKYFAGSTAISRPVLYGLYERDLAIGATATIKMVVHVGTKAKVGKVVRLPVTGRSLADLEDEDTVAAKIRVV